MISETNLNAIKNLLNDVKIPSHSSVNEYISYLTETLIPDLRTSGMDATADDFIDALLWMEVLNRRNK